MKFYHGTTEKKYKEILNDGVLYGKRNAPSRCTYLAVDIEEAKEYGQVILEVEYNPYKNKKMNNYIEGCWQFRVYEPIPISSIITRETGIGWRFN